LIPERLLSDDRDRHRSRRRLYASFGRCRIDYDRRRRNSHKRYRMTSAAPKSGSSNLPPLSGASLIAGGAAKPGPQGKTFTAINAATGEPLEPSYHGASADDVDRAVRRASDSFDSYRDSSGAERATFLRAIAAKIEAMVDALVTRVGLETGLPEPRVRGETA